MDIYLRYPLLPPESFFEPADDPLFQFDCLTPLRELRACEVRLVHESFLQSIESLSGTLKARRWYFIAFSLLHSYSLDFPRNCPNFPGFLVNWSCSLEVSALCRKFKRFHDPADILLKHSRIKRRQFG